MYVYENEHQNDLNRILKRSRKHNLTFLGFILIFVLFFWYDDDTIKSDSVNILRAVFYESRHHV